MKQFKILREHKYILKTDLWHQESKKIYEDKFQNFRNFINFIKIRFFLNGTVSEISWHFELEKNILNFIKFKKNSKFSLICFKHCFVRDILNLRGIQ